jgi:PhnB protein
MEIPQGHQAVMPYLMLRGAGAFIEFTQKVFSATLSTTRMREDGATVMHSEIEIGGSTIMFCDATEEWAPQTANMFVYVQSADATYALALAHGATTVMELSNQDYGRTCGVADPFGNVWWITSVTQK